MGLLAECAEVDSTLVGDSVGMVETFRGKS
jgi:hypothetical protein